MSRFTHILEVSPIDDGETWVVMGEFGFIRTVDGSRSKIAVSPGFQTDFASVPWWIQEIIPRWGKYGTAAVIHDWLYWEQTKSRRYADEALYDAMTVAGVDSVRKCLIYSAVYCFGWWAWIRNAEDKASGFNRVLSSLQIAQGQKSGRRGSLPQMLSAVGRRLHNFGKQKASRHPCR